MRFSGLKILKEGLTGNKGWTNHWRDPEPKQEYDILIIGGGGHGLSTAYYLAKNHGLKHIAVLEKGTSEEVTRGGIQQLLKQNNFCQAIRRFNLTLVNFGKGWNMI